MTDLPKPLTPADCNLRGLPFMPLHTERLLDSDMMALSTGEEFKTALRLWCKSWNQEPAASLPDDDRILAHLAGKEMAAWRKVKAMALRGWIKCSDGRLYHPVIAEEAAKAMAKREAHQEKKAGDNDRKTEEREDRKLLFAALREIGVILPAKGTTTSRLREIAASQGMRVIVTGGHKVVTVTPQGSHNESHGGVTAKTGTGTGTGTDIYKNHLPQTPAEDNPAGSDPGDDESDDSPYGAPRPYGLLAKTLRDQGVSVGSANPDFREWVDAGLTAEEATGGVEIARKTKPAPESIPWSYLAKVLTTQRTAAVKAPPAKPARQDTAAANAEAKRLLLARRNPKEVIDV